MDLLSINMLIERSSTFDIPFFQKPQANVGSDWDDEVRRRSFF